MKHFALVYDVVSDFVERRAPLREALERDFLLMSGPLGDPPDGALLIFRAESAEPVEALAQADPYVTAGLVTAWRVRPWNIVVGAAPAAAKVR